MSDNNKIATDLVSAYVSNNTVPIAEFTALLKSTLGILNGSAPTEAEAVTARTEKPIAKVSVKKSVTPDYLICLDDGRQFKSLKRHLSQLGMTPDDYRAKWNLPADYPMDQYWMGAPPKEEYNYLLVDVKPGQKTRFTLNRFRPWSSKPFETINLFNDPK